MTKNIHILALKRRLSNEYLKTNNDIRFVWLGVLKDRRYPKISIQAQIINHFVLLNVLFFLAEKYRLSINNL